MLHQLLEKHGHPFPFIIDLKNITQVPQAATLFRFKRDSVLFEPTQDVTMGTTISGMSVADLCNQLISNKITISLITFELLQGDEEAFAKILNGHVDYYMEDGSFVSNPVIPLPVYHLDKKVRWSEGIFPINDALSVKINVPPQCEVRMYMFPIELKEEAVEKPGFTPVDKDTEGIITIISRELAIDRCMALTGLTEIGLVNLLSYPTGIDRVDKAIQKDVGWGNVIKILKEIWS
jgi:hypothetical protein